MGMKENKNEWIKTSDKDPVNESSKYWVLFDDSKVLMCRLNNYRHIGGRLNYWQDLDSEDISMRNTSYIEIIKPKAPISLKGKI